MKPINDNDYSNPYDESNDNKTKIKGRITKIIKLLLTCVVIKIILTMIIKISITTTTIIIAMIIINSSNLWKLGKVGNREMQYDMCK